LFVVLLVIDPTSHELGSPAKPGRFRPDKDLRMNRDCHAVGGHFFLRLRPSSPLSLKLILSWKHVMRSRRYKNSRFADQPQKPGRRLQSASPRG
jgi:hypothetical protein